jgi:tetratricopeptide (TPR) repeat protein/TolB-like protein
MSAREVLQSWKEISSYLGRDVRTCRRWEEHIGLPVHRLNGSPKARVMAYKDEIDRWLEIKLHEREIEKSAVPPAPAAPARFLDVLRALRLPPSLQFLRRWYVAAALMGALVIGVLALRTIEHGGPPFVPSGSRPTLAVLPVVNGTGDDGLNYLRESIPDHVIRDLQQSAEHLKVYSFDVVADAVRKLGLEPGAPLTPADLAAVGAKAGAGWLLVTHLGRSGSKLRIDYQLLEAKAAGPLLTDHIPGTEAEMPVLEDRLADGVRRAFDVPTATGPAAFLACSVQATRFYESARAIERKYTLSLAPADLEKIIGLFGQAREADPGCALAYLGLGDAYQLRFVYEGRDPEALRLMNENYRRAYEISPDRAETNVGVAWAAFFEQDMDQAYAYIKKAVELDPSSLYVLTDAGSFLQSVGVLERSVEYFTRVVKAGGATADVFLLRAWSYEQMGFYESALADYDKMIELEPTDFRARCHRARVLILMKRYDAGAAELAVAETFAPGGPSVGAVRALLAAGRGEGKAALAAIAPFRAAGPSARLTYYVARVYAALGLKKEAIGDIEYAIVHAFEEVHDYAYFFPVLNNRRDHFLDKLRGEPRFAELLRREEHKYAERLEKYGGL